MARTNDFACTKSQFGYWVLCGANWKPKSAKLARDSTLCVCARTVEIVKSGEREKDRERD